MLVKTWAVNFFLTILQFLTEIIVLILMCCVWETVQSLHIAIYCRKPSMHVVIQGNIKALRRCFAIEYLGKQKKRYKHSCTYLSPCQHTNTFANVSAQVSIQGFLCAHISTRKETRTLACTHISTCQHTSTPWPASTTMRTLSLV